MNISFRRISGIYLWFITLVVTTHATVAPISIDRMINHSDYIVVGRVKNIFEVEKIKIAEIEVRKLLKGNKNPRKLFVLAQRVWTCDISHCVIDETALFFLIEGANYSFEGHFKEPEGFRDRLKRIIGVAPLLAIHHSGRGRMPFRQVEGEYFVTVWIEDVILPSDVYTIDAGDPDKGDSFIKSVRLRDMIRLIEEIGKDRLKKVGGKINGK